MEIRREETWALAWFSGLSQKDNRIVTLLSFCKRILSVRSSIHTLHLPLWFGLKAVGWTVGSQYGTSEEAVTRRQGLGGRGSNCVTGGWILKRLK
jgi:hypothetical protein